MPDISLFSKFNILALESVIRLKTKIWQPLIMKNNLCNEHYQQKNCSAHMGTLGVAGY